MHVSSRRTPGTRRRSLRGRAAMLGAALLLVTAQVLPAAVLATPNDGSIDASELSGPRGDRWPGFGMRGPRGPGDQGPPAMQAPPAQGGAGGPVQNN